MLRKTTKGKLIWNFNKSNSAFTFPPKCLVVLPTAKSETETSVSQTQSLHVNVSKKQNPGCKVID